MHSKGFDMCWRLIPINEGQDCRTYTEDLTLSGTKQFSQLLFWITETAITSEKS